MRANRQLLVLLVPLLALPLCVAAVAWYGMRLLDMRLDEVAEEYAEVRMLQSVGSDLGAAAAALGADDRDTQELGVRSLRRAEEGLMRYLSSQSETAATAEHQAAEAGSAVGLLASIKAMNSPERRDDPPSEREALASELQHGLDALLHEADEGVLQAHREARSVRQATVTAVFAASLVSLAACVAVAVLALRRLGDRLKALHRTMAAQTSADQVETPATMGGVVSQIEEFNSRLVQRVEESGRELLRRERLAGVGLLAADVAHEINNPMNAMLGLSEVGLRTLERGPLDDSSRQELQESLRIVRREAMRCKGIVERLIAMVRSDRKAGWFDAASLVRETVQVAQAARPDKAACFHAPAIGVSVRAYGRADDARQILLTLLINAADSTGPEGRIEADAVQADREVWLRVRDNGRGFTEAMRRTFFTPFHSHREPGQGLGLGLSIAQALAEGMGATLRPFSEGPGQGSLFVLSIPQQSAMESES